MMTIQILHIYPFLSKMCTKRILIAQTFGLMLPNGRFRSESQTQAFRSFAYFTELNKENTMRKPVCLWSESSKVCEACQLAL